MNLPQGPVMWDNDNLCWVPYEPPEIAHITCCTVTIALCLEDMTNEPEATDEGVEICLKCLRLENEGEPCASHLCPQRSRLDRARYLWGRGRRLHALSHFLWSK